MNVPLPALPHNIEAEQALLGALLINNDAFGMVSSVVDPAQLYEPIHRVIYQAIAVEVAAGRKATPVTLKDILPEVEVGGLRMPAYLARLCAESTTILNAPDYAAHIKALAIIRELIGVGQYLAENKTYALAPDEALREAWERIDQIRAAVVVGEPSRSWVYDLALRVMDQDGGFAVPTTLTDFDRAVAGGLRTGRLIVVGGRPSMGKTILLCSLARQIARQQIGVSIFSLETDAREIMARMISDELARTYHPIVYRDILAHNLPSKFDLERVEEGAHRLRELPIRIDDTSGLTIGEIEARARMDKTQLEANGLTLGVVAIDYLGLVKCGDRYRGRKVDEIGEVTAACKVMGKRLNTAVLLLAQLNRAVESRDDKRPTMSDLRESGNIEQDADVVGLLYRPAYYIERSSAYRKGETGAIQEFNEATNKLELILGKNRLGAATSLELWCNPGTSSIGNWQRVQP